MESGNKAVLVVNRRIRIPHREFRFGFARSRGPGGQNVNKVNTKVTLHWALDHSPSVPADVVERFRIRYARRITKRGDVVVASDRYRDRARNRADCLQKLRRMLLAVAVPPKKRKPTKPTQAAKQRRLQEKKHRSQTKQLRREPPED